MSGFRATAAALLAALLLAGCAQLPRPSVVGEQELVQIPERPLPQANGSIFQSRQGFQPLFEDRRPRMVGDILTVVLNEQVSASKNAAANASRNGSASLTPITVPDKLSKLSEWATELEGDNVFAGSGGAKAPSPCRCWR
jgi:flagellar L-ring protein precursor FlgH